MAGLEYNISVIGVARVESDLAKLERRFQAHQQKINASTSKAASKEDQSLKQMAKGFAQIGKVAAREEVRRHRQHMANIAREERAAVNAIKKEERERLQAERKINAARARGLRQNIRTLGGRTFGGGLAKTLDMFTGGAGGGAGGGLGVGIVAGPIGAAIGATVGVVVDAIKTAFKVGATIVAAVLGSGIREYFKSRKSAMNLAIQMREPGENLGLLNKQILSMSTNEALRTGFGRSEIIGGMESFLKVRGGKAGKQDIMENLSFMSDLAQGTGASLEEVMEASAQLKNKLEGTGASTEDFRNTMRALAGEARLGSTEFKDFVAQGSRLFASAGMYTGDKSKNVVTMGALAQVAIEKGFAPNVEEASMAIQHLGTDLAHNAEVFKLLTKGKSVTGADKKLRDPMELIRDIVRATGGDLTKLRTRKGMVIGDKTFKLIGGFLNIFSEAVKGGKSIDDAMKEVTAAVDKYTQAAMDAKTISENADAVRNTAEMKLSKAWEKIKIQVADDLGPSLEKFADKIKDVNWGDLITDIGTVGKALLNLASMIQSVVDVYNKLFGFKGPLAPKGGEVKPGQKEVEDILFPKNKKPNLQLAPTNPTFTIPSLITNPPSTPGGTPGVETPHFAGVNEKGQLVLSPENTKALDNNTTALNQLPAKIAAAIKTNRPGNQLGTNQ